MYSMTPGKAVYTFFSLFFLTRKCQLIIIRDQRREEKTLTRIKKDGENRQYVQAEEKMGRESDRGH